MPYRDPETLRAVLKVIDEFEYDHSECLGDDFEYPLSVLGSQGDAGQFRTPRHIIEPLKSIRRFQGDCCQQPAQAFSFFPSLQALPTFSPTRQ